MSGIYTQKRNLEDFPRASIWLHNNGVPANPNELTVAQCVPTQSTISFRSYGRDSVTGSDDILARVRELNSQSWLDYSPYDTGHPFDTIKQEWDLSHKLVDIKGGTARYRGPLIPRNSIELPVTTWFPTVPAFDSSFYGTAAVNRTIPNKPIADMANALGELRSAGGVPRIMGTILSLRSRAAFVRSAGKEYLNSVFGWTPLIKDIQSIAGAVLKSNDIVQQYLADSGKNIYRQYTFPEIHTNLSLNNNVFATNVFSGFSSNDSQIFTGTGVDGRLAQVTNHDRKIWFTGSFSYYLSSGIDPAGQMRLYASLARKIVGARISPEVLWELQPWSWLVDWVFNIGQILENIESFQTDGLVMRYGYLMCTDVVTTDVVAYRHGLLDRFGPITRRTVVTRKQRIRATPYGFGLDPTTWSPERWAILVALGMTKTPNALR